MMGNKKTASGLCIPDAVNEVFFYQYLDLIDSNK